MQHFRHDHPLEFIEKQKTRNEDVDCSACADPIPMEDSFNCCAECKFYLHKACTDLPLNINHPLHQQHSLSLQVKCPYPSGRIACDLCYDREGFFYHCSPCKFDLDVKCALSPQLMAGEFSKLQHFSHDHPLIFLQRQNNKLKKFVCAACDEPTSGPVYCCMGCKIYLHKRCAELPPEINHPSHRRHPLVLLAKQPLHQGICSCHSCEHPGKGFIYHCSLCKFGIRIKHIFSSQSENGTHEHPFILLSRVMQFVCDACGTDGDCFPNICTICNFVVHKECISLPHKLRIPRHVHPISHVYFLPQKEYKQWDCKICYDEVTTDYGSYYCSDCNYIVHVNCVREKGWLRFEVKDHVSRKVSMGLVLNEYSMNSAEDVSATEIKHFSHDHNLMLSEQMMDDTYCDGCMETISGPFYFCKQCKFCLHKSCAKLPMKTHFWFFWNEYLHQNYSIFRCVDCKFWSSGFSYTSKGKRITYVSCLRCCAIPDFFLHGGHEHPIFFDQKYNGNCSACGKKLNMGFRCKKSDFALFYCCISLPQTTMHRNDKHPLKLTYHDDGNDPSQHYCDICEEKRDPALWFYSCADCNFTAHPKCARGEHPYIQQGVNTTFRCHPHDLVTVRKVYLYPPCRYCRKPCLDLALECTNPNCDYIIHWDCRWPK